MKNRSIAMTKLNFQKYSVEPPEHANIVISNLAGVRGWVEIGDHHYSYEMIRGELRWVGEDFPWDFPYSIAKIEDEIIRKVENMAAAFKSQEFPFALRAK